MFNLEKHEVQLIIEADNHVKEDGDGLDLREGDLKIMEEMKGNGGTNAGR